MPCSSPFAVVKFLFVSSAVGSSDNFVSLSKLSHAYWPEMLAKHVPFFGFGLWHGACAHGIRN
jgi:hypothetical protein